MNDELDRLLCILIVSLNKRKEDILTVEMPDYIRVKFIEIQDNIQELWKLNKKS